VDARTSVAVLGSCVSRDVFNRRFNPDHAARYRVTATGFRGTLPSLMGRPVDLDEALLAGIAPVERAWLLRDARSGFLADLASDPPDVLLVDFAADVRFGVLDLGAGGYVSAFPWIYRRTTWWTSMDPARRPRRIHVLHDHARYVGLWVDALERLQAQLAAVAPTATAIVIRGRQTRELWLPGVAAPVPLADHRHVHPGEPDRFDAAWDELSQLAIETAGWRSIDLRSGSFPTSDAHPWGAGLTHFAPEFYERVLAALDALVAEPGLRSVAVPPGLTPGRSWDGEPGAGTLEPRPPRRRRRRRLPVRALRRLVGQVKR
jgi:hypothetical protein